MDQRAWVLLAGLVLAGVPAESRAVCTSSGAGTTLEEIVRHIEEEELEYVFVGERHEVGPVKRFTVDLVNALVERGHEVGLYVEGFRTGCPREHAGCSDLARLFNEEAFEALSRESLAVVHPLDPPERDRRAARMAATIAGGTETLRVALVGSSHVISAWDPEAEVWIFGGGLRYPNPGDLVEAFPRESTLTVTLESGGVDDAPYSLSADGCAADYRIAADYRSGY